MPQALPFDTHSAVKRLVEAGFTEKQAETQTELMALAISENIATKQDIKDVRNDIKDLDVSLRQDINGLELSAKQDIKDVRNDINNLESRFEIKFTKIHGEITLLKWMLGIVIAGIASLVVKTFFV
ncbi:CCDC90 family protein [bacterium]|nr:CCDC90 family protein [bacterium]